MRVWCVYMVCAEFLRSQASTLTLVRRQHWHRLGGGRIDAGGRVTVPAALPGRHGTGRVPCAAARAVVTLPMIFSVYFFCAPAAPAPAPAPAQGSPGPARGRALGRSPQASPAKRQVSPIVL